MKTLILFILLLVFRTLCFAGDKLDSLLTSLRSSAKDTTRATLLIKIAGEYDKINSPLFSIYADSALALSESLKFSKGKRDVLYLFGNHYYAAGDFSSALKSHLSAIKVCENEKDSVGILRGLRNVGSIYISTENLDQALKYFTNALVVAEKMKAKNVFPGILSNIAIAHHLKKEYSEAMDYNLKAIKAAEEVNDVKTKSYVLNSIGRLYFNMAENDNTVSDYDKAIDYYKQSLALKEKLGDKRGIANTLGNIGEIFLAKKNYPASLDYFQKGMKYAVETNFIKWQQEAFEKMSRLYKMTGEYKYALEFYEKFIVLRDSLQGTEKQKALAEMQNKYDLEKKDKEIKLLSKDVELQEQKLKTQRMIVWASTIGLIIVFAFAFFIFRRYREKQVVNKIIEEKNKNITDSIHYAKRIQTAMLPKDEIIKNSLTDFFIFYKPKDIVSGDFYFFSNPPGKAILVVADCTGHGVPGAFMSMIGNSLLSKIINENKITKPSLILDQLNNGIIESLKQYDSDSDTSDGMDISICAFDLKKNSLEFSGANRNLLIVSKGKLKEIKGDKLFVGGNNNLESNRFTNHELVFIKSDNAYMFTDGFSDQFGGEHGKKFRTKNFKEKILEISSFESSRQKEILDSTLSSWMGNSEQVDDVLVIGVKHNFLS